MEIILLFCGLVIGLVFMYFILRPKLKSVKEVDNQIARQNKILQEDNKKYTEEQRKLQNTVLYYNDEIEKLRTQRQEIEESIEILQQRIDKDNNVIYEKSFNLMQERLSQAAVDESQRYQAAASAAKEEYLKAMEESCQSFAAMLTQRHEELAQVEEKLSIMRAKADAAIAAAKREEEKLLEIDKYKLCITEVDLTEINRLREIIPFFRNPRAICKIIWESYYRNLTTEMINRVVGPGSHTGIYKLTNLINQKIYIGQAVDIGTRWKDHIKCGLGIDTPGNMLYAAMLKDGVENFSFEVLEECDRSQLNDRERYYIDFYRAQEFGYNMSKGGART